MKDVAENLLKLHEMAKAGKLESLKI